MQSPLELLEMGEKQVPHLAQKRLLRKQASSACRWLRIVFTFDGAGWLVNLQGYNTDILLEEKTESRATKLCKNYPRILTVQRDRGLYGAWKQDNRPFGGFCLIDFNLGL